MSIPKIIHYCWFGRGEIPERDKLCIESWKKFCPDYEIIEWTEDNYDITQIPYMKEAYDAKRWAFVSDYIRMDLIYRFGGIYMDTDVELLRPLDTLLSYQAYVGLEAESNCIGFGCGFGAEKGSSLLKELCDYYRSLHFINEDGSLNLLPHPVIVTEYLKTKGFEVIPGQIKMVGEFTVFPAEYFCPQAFSTGKIKITDKTYSIHHYHASWQTEEELREFKVFHRFTKLLGAQIGELIYQGYKTLCNEGFGVTLKKASQYLTRK